jgi:hypothetical protein
MYIDGDNLMPKEPKGCCRVSNGCKDQSSISKATLRECKSRKKYLCIAWIDYQKAFYRVSHSWIIKSLEVIGVNNKFISLTRKLRVTGEQG